MDQETVLRTLRQFRKELESNSIRVDQLILYGSHADGTAREDSDIDVIVISPDFSDKSFWERITILSDAIYKVYAPIEASSFTPEEWKNDKSLIVDYARDGVLVK